MMKMLKVVNFEAKEIEVYAEQLGPEKHVWLEHYGLRGDHHKTTAIPYGGAPDAIDLVLDTLVPSFVTHIKNHEGSEVRSSSY